MEDIDARVLVIDKRGWILLVHDPGGPKKGLPGGKSFDKPPGWAMPGGRSDLNDQNEADTAYREVKEETNLCADIDTNIFSRRQKDNYQKVAFIGYPVSGEIKINTAEIDDCRWFPPRILCNIEFDMYPLHRAMAQELLRKLKNRK